MPSEAASSTYSKHRIEAVSDGIFTIAMTLLVLNLKPPTGFAPGHVWSALRDGWPLWVSLGFTFALAARFWVLQHDMLQTIETIDRHALLLTFFFLGLITALPFTTSLLSAHFTDHSVLLFYLAHELAIALTLVFTLEVCRHHRHTVLNVSLRAPRLKLYGMSATLAACMLVTWLLDLRWIAVVPPVFGALERYLRTRRTNAKR